MYIVRWNEESWRQRSGLTNRNHIRLQLGIRLHVKPKSNNYLVVRTGNPCAYFQYGLLELTVVNVADIWSERLCSYLGRSRLVSGWNYTTHRKSVVTTNGEKSAEIIITANYQEIKWNVIFIAERFPVTKAPWLFLHIFSFCGLDTTASGGVQAVFAGLSHGYSDRCGSGIPYGGYALHSAGR